MTRHLGTLGFIGTTLLVAACGQHQSAQRPAGTPASEVQAGHGPSYSSGAEEASPGAASAPAPASGHGFEPASADADDGAWSRASKSAPRDEAEAREVSPRPGLGTSWGEARESHVSTTSFVRENPSAPFGVASFLYNDETGVRAASRGAFVDHGQSVASLGRGITVTLAQPGGAALRSVSVGSRSYAVGRDGDRYVIRVENRSPVRLEAVATVDGLDVVDGGDGSFEKRGYVIAAYDSLEIEGFRESQGTVRAFRFCATDDSYASRRGKGRNVGVIGVAVFEERGANWQWTRDELDRRDSADPFPRGFAPPPPSQWRAR
jgi:hypothetical protein